VKRFWAILCALFALSIATTADAVTYRPMIYIPAHGGLPATQSFNAGVLTRAGYGGCNDSGANGSIPFSNIRYTGTHASSLVFQATGTTSSADGVWFIDSHHCMVPKGTYGNAPQTITTATYVITDQNGATGNVNVVAIANRWDVTNIDAGTNADTTSSFQLANILQASDPTGIGATRTSPQMGDTVALRCGTVIDPPKFDSISGTSGIATPGDIRIKRHAYSGMVTEYTTGNGGGAYTAMTLPVGDWINITSDTCSAGQATPTIRHTQFNGTNQAIQGFNLNGLNFELDYNGTNGLNNSTGILQFGSGSTVQSFFQVTNNTFHGATTVVGQRGEQGIFSVSVGNNNGTSGCSTLTPPTIVFTDNHNGPPNGSGAAFTANVIGGVTQSWSKTAQGANYDYNAQANGVAPSGAGTWATVTGNGCATTPTATPVLAGGDIVIGILGSGSGAGNGSTELYIHDNSFTDLLQGLSIQGAQYGVSYTTPSNIWFIGNTCSNIWGSCAQFNNAAPVYSEWNLMKNIKYASGAVHTDCELRYYQDMVGGSTYPFGDVIGNVCVRASGQTTSSQPAGVWLDAQGWFMTNAASGIILSGCKFEGNIYIGTFANAYAALNCDGSTMTIAFNEGIQDPVSSITQPNENGAASSSTVQRVLTSVSGGSGWVAGNVSYNALSGTVTASSGPSPSQTCNKTGVTFASYAGAYAAPPADYTTLQTMASVQAAFGMKVGGTLDKSVTLCTYNVGSGTYFDYVNRINTAPF
jgi:hypothetical protein